MANFTSIIEDIKQFSSYSEKRNYINYIQHAAKKQPDILTDEGKKELYVFAFGEIKHLLSLVTNITTYREKDEVFGYADALLGLLMMLYESPADMPAENNANVRSLMELISKERFIENTINLIFGNKLFDNGTIKNLIDHVSAISDEYQKGQLFKGLAHYQNNLFDIPADSKQIIANYIATEIDRYVNGDIDDTIIENLEFMCDVAKHFMNDSLALRIYEVFKLGKNNISFYAADSLLKSGNTIPEYVVASLANDLEYACMTYSMLCAYDLCSMFPDELNNPVYLAKSDLARWLTYPTELGQLPDEIEYIGKIDTEDEYYYVFKYKSDSDTIGDDCKGKWLIGWSNDQGGTFSNFDLYSDFEADNVEDTLKNIAENLL